MQYNQLKHGVEVRKQYADNVPDILCYPDELIQVWTNLIHNALQAMADKGVLTIKVVREANDIVISITDNGPGIREEIRDRIFEPFFTTKPAGEGSGLGLDICRRIVERHDGQITVESEPGRTTFTVRLQIKTAAQEPENGDQAPTAEMQDNTGSS